MKQRSEITTESIEILSSLPSISSSNERQAFIFRAGLPNNLTNQIVFDGAINVFIINLVDLLIRFGKLPDGRYALEAVLEAAKDYVGIEKKERINTLIGEMSALDHNSGATLISGRTPQKKDYLKGQIDFGIITIREDEFRAVLQRFPPTDNFEGNRRYAISRVQATDSNYYSIAMVRCPEQGTGEGQDTARDMIEDLDPKWIFLVGIAGAVPSYEFTLGDVVLATRLLDFSIEAAVEGREPEYGITGGPMHKAVQDLLAHLPAIDSKFQDWNDEKSIGMPHPLVSLTASKFYGPKDWRKDVKEKLARHFSQPDAQRIPIYTTGAIASSDRLVKDSQLIRDWRSTARQLLAVEMELAGVYRAARRKEKEYPIIAVRGISDIVGYKRHPDWTSYACHSAAALAQALIKAGVIETMPK